MTRTAMTLVGLGTFVLGTMVLSTTVNADVFTITSFSAEVEAAADGYDSKKDQSDYEQNTDSANSFAELPIGVSASASTNIGGGSGSASVNGTLDTTSFYLTASGSGDGYGDKMYGSGSGYGDGDFDVEFTVDITMHVRIDLSAYADGMGNIGNGWAGFYADGALIDSADTDSDWYEEVILFVDLEPGIVYKVSGYGGGGGYSDSGGGSSAMGDGNVTVTALCPDFGELALGDNAFDTTSAAGFECDLTGHCDPGPFGTDIIYNAAYFTFTPGTTSTYTFSTCNQAVFDTRLAILATACDSSSVLACLDDTDGCGNYTTELSIDLEAGTEYTVVLGGYSSGNLGSGTLTISALPLIVVFSSLDATLESDSYAYFCGDESEAEQSDDDHDEANPTTLAELPESVSTGAFTCCSDGNGYASLGGTMGINAFTASADTSASACGDFDGMCADASSYGNTDATFSLELTQYCSVEIEWMLYGDGGGSGNFSLRAPDDTWLIDEYADADFNEGKLVLELAPGIYRLGVSSWASGDPYLCSYADGYAWASTNFVKMPNPNDINGDGFVNGADLALLLGAWGTCVGCPEDLNGDGVVNGADLATLLGAWFNG